MTGHTGLLTCVSYPPPPPLVGPPEVVQETWLSPCSSDVCLTRCFCMSQSFFPPPATFSAPFSHLLARAHHLCVTANSSSIVSKEVPPLCPRGPPHTCASFTLLTPHSHQAPPSLMLCGALHSHSYPMRTSRPYVTDLIPSSHYKLFSCSRCVTQNFSPHIMEPHLCM